jgi:hypothetical protein
MAEVGLTVKVVPVEPLLHVIVFGLLQPDAVKVVDCPTLIVLGLAVSVGADGGVQPAETVTITLPLPDWQVPCPHVAV